jgi:hypothetical protein
MWGGVKGRQRFETQAQGGQCAELEERNELKWFRTEFTGGLFEQSNKTSRKSWERLV